jgi:putative phage-type endonuclease
MSAPDRSTYIGGSDVAAILGVSPWKSAFRLYQEKIGAFSEEVTPAKAKLFRRGHRWEPIVVEMLIDELQDRGHDVQIIGRNARYQDPELPFLACELDLELLIDGEETNAEMKTVHLFAAKYWGEEGTDEIPIYYASQGMHGLMIKPRRRCVFAALIGADDLRVHQIERDDETIAAIRAREVEFWQRVQSRTPPDPEAIEDVRWLYAKDDGDTIEADDELLALCQALKDAKAANKAGDARADVLTTQIMTRIGNAATVLYRGQRIATWKSNKAGQKTDWQAAYLDLSPAADHINQFTKTVAGNRPLLIK